MSKGYVIYNPQAGDGKFAETISSLSETLNSDLEYIEINRIKDYTVFFSNFEKGDFLVVCGGDGTLNRFVNDTADINFDGDVLYYPIGSGNDFAHDLGRTKGCEPFCVNEYLKDLPLVTVNNKKYRFINGIGFGIDGYCCEVGDKLRETSDKPVNYSSIAIKGLLFHYRPTNAKVTVDGVTHTYNRVWLAPTMHGRFYGGGMMPTPEQNRKDSISVMVLYGTGKLKTLVRFPTLFKGTHVKYKDMVAVHSGKEITVEFDRPTSLQIDGETILGVTSYTANCV